MGESRKRARDTKALSDFGDLRETVLDSDEMFFPVPEAISGGIPTVQDVIDEASKMTEVEFLKNYMHPFLIGVSKARTELKQSGWMAITGEGPERAQMEEEFARCPVYFVVKKYENIGEDGRDDHVVAVGRLAEQDVVLPFSCVSKCHAEFRENPQGWEIIDTESLNGTFIDGVRLVPNRPYQLQSGSEIDFSKHFSFFFAEPATFYEYIRNIRPAKPETSPGD